MSTIPEPRQADPDIISVAKFAEKYRVDASIVRGWIRLGYINYVLDGAGRQMRKIRVSEAVKPLTEPVKPQGVDDESGSKSNDSGSAGGGETQGAEGHSGGTGHSASDPEGAGRVGSTAQRAATPPVSSQRQGNRNHRR